VLSLLLLLDRGHVGVDNLARCHALRPRLEDGVEMEDGHVDYVKECGVCGAGVSWIQSLLL
jgi:hypothetical protein